MKRKLFYICFVLVLMMLTCTISTKTVSARITHRYSATAVTDAALSSYCTYSYNSGTKTLTLLPANINAVMGINQNNIAYICNKYPSAENLELIGFVGTLQGFTIPGNLTIDGLGQANRSVVSKVTIGNGANTGTVSVGGTLTVKNSGLELQSKLSVENLIIEGYDGTDSKYSSQTVQLSGYASNGYLYDLEVRNNLIIKHVYSLRITAQGRPTLPSLRLNNVHLEHCRVDAFTYMVPVGSTTRYAPMPINGNLTMTDVALQYSAVTKTGHGCFDVKGNLSLTRVRSLNNPAPYITCNGDITITNAAGLPRYVRASSTDTSTTYSSLKNCPSITTSRAVAFSGVNYNSTLSCGGLTATNSQLGTINSSGPVTLTDTQAGDIVAGRGLTTNRCGVGTVIVNGDDSTKSNVIGTQLTGGTFNSVVTMDKITSTGTINFTVGARGSVIKNGTFSGAPAVNGTNFVEVVRGTFNDSGTKSSFLLADGSEASVTDTSTASTPGSPGVAVPTTGACGACGGAGRIDSYSSCSTCGGTGKVSYTQIEGATSGTPGKFGQVTTVKLSNPPVIIDWGEFPGINLDLKAGTP